MLKLSTENIQNTSIFEKKASQILKKTSHSVVIAFDKITKYRKFILALLSVLVFFWPSLRQGSINAGLLYTGDVLGYYVPAILKTHSLLSSHHFSAIDYSLFNGSSDFFLNANFFPLHPIVILHCLLSSFKTASIQSTGHFLVLMLAFHTFLACYFSLKLFARYFLFEFGMTVLVATGFAFSWYTVAAMGEPPFVFCASIVPWVIYGALRFAEVPTLSMLIRSALPVTLEFLGGYLPLGLAGLAMSAVLVTTMVLFINAAQVNSLEQRVRLLILASLPFFLGFFITSPYLYAVYKFHHQTSGSMSPGLFYSAHQLAELPQAFIRILSSRFVVPGPSFEFSVFWGVIALTIFSVFFLSPKAINSFSKLEWRTFKVAGIMYFATVLAIYGEHSAVSSLVYYFVPQIGTMHIYQRFLQPAQLLLMMMIVLMLKALIDSGPHKALRTALVVLALLSFACGLVMTFRSEYALMYGINNHLLFELMLGCLFAGMLMIPGRAFVYYGTAILFCLPSLNTMYTLSLSGNTFIPAEQRQPMALNLGMQGQLLQYLKRFNDKPIIKYVDITPVWNKSGVETFPKDFPYLVLKEVNLSSYGGATFYLSALADYLRRMPVGGSQVVVNPDWHWLEETEADFMIATKDDLATNELVHQFVERNKPEDLYYLPNDAILIPLKMKNNSFGSMLYDNGYFRVYPSSHSSMISTNLALHKIAKQSGQETGAPAQLVVDGNTDGNFSHGSVSHTSKDQNAWIDIDLGKQELIDRIKIWNRTDCCGERLNHYWVFISNTPFLSTDTVQSLHKRTQTWGKLGTPSPLMAMINTGRVQGRYVRVQLSGTQPLEDSYLSLAEIEVLKFENPDSSPLNTKTTAFKSRNFYSNNANYTRLEFEADTPTTVQYLFWNNPRIKYYLNGERITIHNDNGLVSIDVPAGKNTLELRYRHTPLILFWLFYTLFTFLLVCTFIPECITSTIKSKYKIIRGTHEA